MIRGVVTDFTKTAASFGVDVNNYSGNTIVVSSSSSGGSGLLTEIGDVLSSIGDWLASLFSPVELDLKGNGIKITRSPRPTCSSAWTTTATSSKRPGPGRQLHRAADGDAKRGRLDHAHQQCV